MHWLVTWVIVSSFLVPCSAPEPACDQYGRCGSNMVTLAIACYDTEKTEHTRSFKTEKEAREFVDGMQDGLCGDLHLNGYYITDVKIFKAVEDDKCPQK